MDPASIAALVTAVGALMGSIASWIEMRGRLKTAYATIEQQERELKEREQSRIDQEEDRLRTFLTAEVMRLEARNAKLFDELQSRGDLVITIQQRHERELTDLRKENKARCDEIEELKAENRRQHAEIIHLRDENRMLRTAMTTKGIEVPPEQRWTDYKTESEREP